MDDQWDDELFDRHKINVTRAEWWWSTNVLANCGMLWDLWVLTGQEEEEEISGTEDFSMTTFSVRHEHAQ